MIFFLSLVDIGKKYVPSVIRYIRISAVAVKPLVVQILTKESRVSAGKNYEVECRTSGSRPDAVITWWKANKPIKKMAQTVSLLSMSTACKLSV